MTHPSDDLLARLEAAERSAPDPAIETGERVWSAIESRLTEGPPPPLLDDAPLFAPGSSSLGLTLLKIVGGLAVLGAIGLGAGALAPRSRPPLPDPTSPMADAAPETVPSSDPLPPPPGIERVPDPPAEPASPPAELTPAPAPEAAGVPKPRSSRRTPTKPNLAKTLTEELALMQSITASLKADEPSKTLRLVAEHERDFPSGQLVEERRAAKARALCRQGKTGAGRKEAARFEQRWPSSIHLAAVREDCDLH